jgi:ferredoxin-type protein NapG
MYLEVICSGRGTCRLLIAPIRRKISGWPMVLPVELGIRCQDRWISRNWPVELKRFEFFANRRHLLKALGIATLATALSNFTVAAAQRFGLRYLRPPGALPEREFLDNCIRCGQCAQVCPNQCIKFFDTEQGLAARDTPYIIPREKACILCMKCGDVCPTGAIVPVKYEAAAIVAEVDMGQARVDEQLCLSFQGKTCGVCYRACPLPDVALRVGRLEQPHVSELCVGCGLCERSCIQIPQAIKVIPRHLITEMAASTNLSTNPTMGRAS